MIEPESIRQPHGESTDDRSEGVLQGFLSDAQSPIERLRDSGARLNAAIDNMTSTMVRLDAARTDGGTLVSRFEGFAELVDHEYPSLAGPARAIAELFRDLDVAVAKLTSRAESVVAVGGRIADIASDFVKESGA